MVFENKDVAKLYVDELSINLKNKKINLSVKLDENVEIEKNVIYENEPMEKNTMIQKPRLMSTTFFNWKELTTSIIQGIAITAGTLSIYHYGILHNLIEIQIRTMVFIVLIAANVTLTLVNRSFYNSVLTTLKYKNNLVGLIISITIAMTGLLLYVPMLSSFFQFEPLSLSMLLVSIGAGFISVIWYEVVKYIKRLKNKLS
jgi:Ca2+-transporting ATPase